VVKEIKYRTDRAIMGHGVDRITVLAGDFTGSVFLPETKDSKDAGLFKNRTGC